MAYSDIANDISKTGIYILELDFDDVESATSAENSDGSFCYNTPFTSQSFAPLTIGTRTVSFCSEYCKPMAGYPRQLTPTIQSVSWSTDKLRVGRGVSNLGTINITLADHIDPDTIEDPYYSSRSVTPQEGSYWRRKKRRVKYFDGRVCRLKIGYRTDVYDSDNFITLNAVIKEIKGPDSRGMVTIQAVNPLSESYRIKAEVPEKADLTLDGDITAVATSLDITGDTTDYQGAQVIVIGDEYISGTISSNTMTVTSRGFGGTTADSHSNGENITVAFHASGYVDEIISQILTGPGRVDSSYIPTAEWESERNGYLLSYDFDVYLGEDDQVQELIDELCEQCGIYFYFDWFSNEFKLRAIKPASPGSLVTLTDDDLLGPITDDTQESERVSTVLISYGRRTANADIDKPESYSALFVGTERGVGAGEHSKPSFRYIKSRWIGFSQPEAALQTAAVIASHFEDGLTTYKFELDAGVVETNNIDLATIIKLTSIDFVDDSDLEATQYMQVVQMTQTEVGHSWKLECILSPFDGRYAVFMADGSPDYVDATEEQREPAGFFCGDDLLMPNGDDPYLFQ